MPAGAPKWTVITGWAQMRTDLATFCAEPTIMAPGSVHIGGGVRAGAPVLAVPQLRQQAGSRWAQGADDRGEPHIRMVRAALVCASRRSCPATRHDAPPSKTSFSILLPVVVVRASDN
jgi:hypothetical protein